MGRKKLVMLSKRYGIALRQSYEREGPRLSRRVGGYAHAKQFKRMQRVLRRQRTLLGRVIRDMTRKLGSVRDVARETLLLWLERAERLHGQRVSCTRCTRRRWSASARARRGSRTNLG